MPRRRRSGASSSSEQSANSDQGESLNQTDELPDPGLPKTNGKDVKEKKRVSFNFPVEVITKDGKFTGMGTIDLMETSTPSSDPRTPKPRKTKEDPKEIVYDLTQEDNVIPLKSRAISKNQDTQKNHDKPKAQKPVKKQVPVAIAKKKETAEEVREAKRRGAEAVKQSIEDEKRAKAEFEEMNKIFKPGECLKYMNIEIHPELAASCFMEPLKAAVRALGSRLVETEERDPGLLVWTRSVPRALTSEGGLVQLAPPVSPCGRVFYILPAERVAALEARGAGGARELVARRRASLSADSTMTLVVFGVAEMFKSLPRSNGTPRMSQEKFVKAVGDLQMELMLFHKSDLLMVNSAAELAALVAHYTRAVAEGPYKKAKRDIDEQAEFYMRGDNKNCVTVDKDGNGLSRLWEQMIATLPMSSLEVARTLGGEYKTPRALTQELLTTGGLAKIADIGVTRANVPGAKSRRLGPEFARKLHTLFTSEDENAIIE